MHPYRNISDILADRRKEVSLSIIMENLIQSPYLLCELENPFEIFESLQSNDFLDASTASWKQLNVEAQMRYASQYQSWYSKMLGRSSSKFLFERDLMAFEMVLIPPMSISFGKDEKYFNRADAFWMSKTPITQRQWTLSMGRHHQHFMDADAPVINLTFEMCQRFCNKYDLKIPQDTEWELACRAGTTTDYYFGDDKSQLQNYAVYSKFKLHSVGSLKPNAFGLHDMLGNVWEICKAYHVINHDVYPACGGSYKCKAGWCKSGMRMLTYVTTKQDDLGFRVIREI